MWEEKKAPSAKQTYLFRENLEPVKIKEIYHAHMQSVLLRLLGMQNVMQTLLLPGRYAAADR